MVVYDRVISMIDNFNMQVTKAKTNYTKWC